jgi:hypothetical protein
MNISESQRDDLLHGQLPRIAADVAAVYVRPHQRRDAGRLQKMADRRWCLMCHREPSVTDELVPASEGPGLTLPNSSSPSDDGCSVDGDAVTNSRNAVSVRA